MGFDRIRNDVAQTSAEMAAARVIIANGADDNYSSFPFALSDTTF